VVIGTDLIGRVPPAGRIQGLLHIGQEFGTLVQKVGLGLKDGNKFPDRVEKSRQNHKKNIFFNRFFS
jgi:hypothetical protein